MALPLSTAQLDIYEDMEDGDIIEKELTSGALLQIDLSNSTAFAAKGSSVESLFSQEKADLERSIAERRKIARENELSATRADILQRQQNISLHQVATLGTMIGNLQKLAELTGVQVLGFEGDLIRVYSPDKTLLGVFALASKEILDRQLTTQKVNDVGYRIGAAEVSKEQPLTVYSQRTGNFTEVLTVSGEAVKEVGTKEKAAEDFGVCIQGKLFGQEEDLHFGQLSEVPEIKEKLEDLKEKIGGITIESEGQSALIEPTIRNIPIAYFSVSFDPSKDDLEELRRKIGESGLMLLGFGSISEGKITFKCKTRKSGTPANDLLNGVRKFGENGISASVGVTYGPIWLGNISGKQNGAENLDVMGADVNLAARISSQKFKEQPAGTLIYGNSQFLQELKDEGYAPRDKEDPDYIYAKGYSSPIQCINLSESPIEKIEYAARIDQANTIQEINAILREQIYNYLQITDTEALVNSTNFLVHLISNIAGIEEFSIDKDNPKMADLKLLCKTVISRLQNSDSIWDLSLVLNKKSLDLNHPSSVISSLDPQTRGKITKLAILTFGRSYSFLKTSATALGVSEDDIKYLIEKGLIIESEEKTREGQSKLKLKEPFHYILDTQASLSSKSETHTQIVEMLTANIQNLETSSEGWINRVRPFLLHAIYADGSRLSPETKILINKFINFTIDSGLSLDLVTYGANLLYAIPDESKAKYCYQVALAFRKFNQNQKALDYLNLSKLYQDESLSTEIEQQITLISSDLSGREDLRLRRIAA